MYSKLELTFVLQNIMIYYILNRPQRCLGTYELTRIWHPTWMLISRK